MILDNAVNYCETTTIHGFSYWVSARNLPEKLFWVLVVIIGFICASLIISTAIEGWLDEPGVTLIKTFSKVCDYNFYICIAVKSICFRCFMCISLRQITCAIQPVTEVALPSLTFCEDHGPDTGEYVRNVFNNLAYEGNEGNCSSSSKQTRSALTPPVN